MNVFLSSTVVLLAILQKIYLTLGIWLAHTARHLSIWAFAHLSGVVKVCYLSNSFFRMQSHRFVVPKSSIFVINIILAKIGTNLVMSTMNVQLDL